MKKTIITVVGQDKVGIIAKVCTYLSNNQINILDISQTIVQGYFNMMMLTDTSKSAKDMGILSQEWRGWGRRSGWSSAARTKIFSQRCTGFKSE